MKEILQVNLNDEVWIRVTSAGIRHLDKIGYMGIYRAKRRKDTRTAWKIWEMMEVFGPSMRIGATPLLIDITILIERES